MHRPTSRISCSETTVCSSIPDSRNSINATDKTTGYKQNVLTNHSRQTDAATDNNNSERYLIGFSNNRWLLLPFVAVVKRRWSCRASPLHSHRQLSYEIYRNSLSLRSITNHRPILDNFNLLIRNRTTSKHQSSESTHTND